MGTSLSPIAKKARNARHDDLPISPLEGKMVRTEGGNVEHRAKLRSYDLPYSPFTSIIPVAVRAEYCGRYMSSM